MSRRKRERVPPLPGNVRRLIESLPDALARMAARPDTEADVLTDAAILYRSLRMLSERAEAFPRTRGVAVVIESVAQVLRRELDAFLDTPQGHAIFEDFNEPDPPDAHRERDPNGAREPSSSVDRPARGGAGAHD